MSGETTNNPLTRRHWVTVQAVVPTALRLLVDGNAETPTEAVEAVNRDLGPAERADAAWVVEQAAERARESDALACPDCGGYLVEDTRAWHADDVTAYRCEDCGSREIVRDDEDGGRP